MEPILGEAVVETVVAISDNSWDCSWDYSECPWPTSPRKPTGFSIPYGRPRPGIPFFWLPTVEIAVGVLGVLEI
jgi:hypothetical protein